MLVAAGDEEIRHIVTTMATSWYLAIAMLPCELF